MDGFKKESSLIWFIPPSHPGFEGIPHLYFQYNEITLIFYLWMLQEFLCLSFHFFFRFFFKEQLLHKLWMTQSMTESGRKRERESERQRGREWKRESEVNNNTFLQEFELSQSCQGTVMLTIDSCANVSHPRLVVRVYKTHFPLGQTDSKQRVKTTKLSQTAVCALNDHIYLLTVI